MRNKSVFLFLLLIIYNLPVAAQEKQGVLIAPDNWQSELIPFPISFAPTIDYAGYEDLRFTPGWAKKDNEQFWTYTFAWHVDKHISLTAKSLTTILHTYFDGLMGITAKDAPDSIKQLKTIATVNKSKDGFAGNIKVYDAFFAKQVMTLYVTVKESYCPKSRKQLILFRFSPKGFNHAVWMVFDEVTVVGCE